MEEKQKTRFVWGTEIRPGARKSVTKNSSFTLGEILDQMHLEDQRKFLGLSWTDIKTKITSLAVGAVLEFTDSRFIQGLDTIDTCRIKRTSYDVFTIIQPFGTDVIYQPRGAVTSQEAQDAGFGMGFAATGGNSIPKKH